MSKITITVAAETHLGKLPWSIRDEIKRRLTLDNPAFQSALHMGRWTGGMEQTLKFYGQQGTGSLIVPRGFTGQAIRLLGKTPYTIIDRRRSLPAVAFQFTGILKDFQKRAVADILRKDQSVLQSATGSGKTVMALAVIAERKQPTLIVVHTRELLNQWVDRIQTFLGIPKAEIGVIGGGKCVIGDRVTVAIINSLYPIADEIKDHFGFLLVDECHRTPSRTFTEAVKAFDCRYMLGLSATPFRRDGLTKLIYFYLGDCSHSVSKPELIENGSILRAEIIKRQTGFTTWRDPVNEYQAVLSELTASPARNEQIVFDVRKAVSQAGGVCLVLSDRQSHCDTLTAMLVAAGIVAVKLTGRTGKKERTAIVERLKAGAIPVLVATGQLIGEGFDCAGLSYLFLTTPIKFSGRLLQYLGRVLRPAAGKDKAVVYDYVDSHCSVFEAAARARQRVYEAA
jgi:superfamily II DNA or RNA helicase